VAIEPRKVLIVGEQGTRLISVNRKPIWRDRCTDRIFRDVQLPLDVDPNHATAELRDGILELLIPTLLLSASRIVQRTPDWIVRNSDYEMWRASAQSAQSAQQHY
jgi:HSP20 family molecular chaperone IbpA